MSNTEAEPDEFCALVELEEPATDELLPSAVTRRLWVKYADSYDIPSLHPLWLYQIKVLKKYIKMVGKDLPLRDAMVDVMAASSAYTQRPAPGFMPEMQERIDNYQGHWTEVQEAYEHVALAWEEVGW